MNRKVRTRTVTPLLNRGEFFVYDTKALQGGDLLYCEVLSVHRGFERTVDHAGDAAGGYEVRVYCAQDDVQSTSKGVVDYYSWDYVDNSFIRLSREQMFAARDAGWPDERAFLKQLGL
jgi:hypothetical protein